MKIFLFLLLFFGIPPAQAQEDAWSYTSDDQNPGEPDDISPQERETMLEPSLSAEENDPFESINRGIFAFNEGVDMVFLDPLSRMYNDLIPEFLRERVGYGLRNLSEPIVLVNNILQGELEDARTTIWRFLFNSTLGVGGLFDVSTDLDLPYKKEDFGLTLASWGVEAGPYIVLPILGPSNLRDTVGRLGDYAFDPINWWAYAEDKPVYSYARTGAQLLDAKASNLEFLEGLKKDSIDYYATIRTWYHERRRDLMLRPGERKAIDTPRPDEDDEE